MVETRRSDVADELHGEVVPDPYRWLEDTDSAETTAWVSAQNQETMAYLDQLPQRDEIKARLLELWDITRYGVPHPYGGQWFFTRHDPGADQPVLRVADHPGEEGRVLLDPNGLSDNGTVALTSWAVSPDGSRLAYATSGAGSDWMTWRVRDVGTGEDHPDVVEWSKWSEAAWLPDASGFFYGALDPPTSGQEYLATTAGLRTQLHLLGAPTTADEVVYSDADPEWEPVAATTGNGRWLVLTLHRGTNLESVVRVMDLRDRAAGLRELVAEPTASAEVVGSLGTTFFVLTDADAPNKRIVAIDLDDTAPEQWREVVPEGSDPILDAVLTRDRLISHVLHDASSQLQIWTTAGAYVADATLPDQVTVTELVAGAEPTEPTEPTEATEATEPASAAHCAVTSFLDPGSVWAIDVESASATRVRESGVRLGTSPIVVSRATAPSTDGTPVPMFLVHREDVPPTGEVLAMLYGYGGFDIPITPTFNAARLVWVERGGLLAVANLRGGGEFGKSWYDAGKREHKQNVFNDFAACARWLTTSGWSHANRIVINGGSNGGLLVGALLTQHPELVGAAVPEVGVLDLLRFHQFTIGWAWTGDYGNPDHPEEYRWVRAYSPLHAIRPGTSYPATLVMTGDHDDRVVPGHSFKFAAALQHAQRGTAPILIRIETAAGHGAGTPVSKLVEARADMLAFAEAALATS